MKNNYLNRMARRRSAFTATQSRRRFIRSIDIDANGQGLSGANRYSIRFAPGQLPPVNAFWSLTMYESAREPARRQSAQSLPINSPMLPQFKRDADGGVTLIIQNESPGRTRKPTGCPRRRGLSPCICGSIGPRPKRWTASGPSAAAEPGCVRSRTPRALTRSLLTKLNLSDAHALPRIGRNFDC